MFFVLISGSAFGQENYVAPSGLNNWYVELGGPAMTYSLNYEKYLYKTYSENYTWTARVGASYMPFSADLINAIYIERNTFVFPFSTTILKGSNKEKLEFGGGFSLLSEGFNNSEIIPHMIIGLRVMETNNICFRMNYVPMWRDGAVIHWIGISLGKNFSFK